MGRVAWILVKWLLIPAALAAAGYYIIGPRIGKLPTDTKVDSTPAQGATVEPANNEGATRPTTYPAPDVNVRVGTKGHGETRPRHHRRKPKPKPDEVTTPASDKVIRPPDRSGTTGGDGGTTGGNTGGTDG